MERIKLFGDSRVYVLCPAYFKTGGTELLHQYVFTLRNGGIAADIVYPDASAERNINEAFLGYTKNYLGVGSIEDDEKNILVLPEIYTKYLGAFKNIRTIIWWESVDNYMIEVSLLFNLKSRHYRQMLHVAKTKLLGRRDHLRIKDLSKANYHFVQSYYAMDFLKKHNIVDNVFYVSDYINDVYLTNNVAFRNRKDIVLYNPKKGLRFTKKILRRDKKHVFVPLIGLTNEQVLEYLSSSKVYIDFGDHPGKDRFPREAAMCGCCVLTNRKGSAGFHQDVPIDDRFKFDNRTSSINRIIDTIDSCLTNYDDVVQEYSEYRDFIKNEKSIFIENVLGCYTK